MSRSIIGITVGTAISPASMERKLKPVKTVNGIAPDANGNVEIAGGGGSGAVAPMYVKLSEDGQTVAPYDTHDIMTQVNKGGNVYLDIGNEYCQLTKIYENGYAVFTDVRPNGSATEYFISADSHVGVIEHDLADTATIVAEVIASLPVYAGEVL